MQKEGEICIAQSNIKFIYPRLHHLPLRLNGLLYAIDDLLSFKQFIAVMGMRLDKINMKTQSGVRKNQKILLRTTLESS